MIDKYIIKNPFILSLQRGLLMLAVILMNSCVYDFTPSGLESAKELLVIEGDILAGDYSYFKISTTIDLASSEEVAYITDADVWVEGESGERINAYLSSDKPGAFAANTSGLDMGKKYKLCVTIQGKGSYESDYLSIAKTSQIDSVTYSIGANKEFLQIEVTSHDNENPENKYYRWNYQEDWETHVAFVPRLRYNELEDKEEDIPEEEQYDYYYCWNKALSSGIYIASTERLSENVIYKQKINTIYSDNRKISYIYSIEVSQVSLTKEGYIYWETLQKNTDETGGIFAPQPSELRGNIKSVTNPDEPVIGYISASTVSKKRIYIYSSDLNIYKDFYQCLMEPHAHMESLDDESPPINMWLMLHQIKYVMIYYLEADAGLITFQINWTPVACADCRARGGTKEKPSFWPNNHE